MSRLTITEFNNPFFPDFEHLFPRNESHFILNCFVTKQNARF